MGGRRRQGRHGLRRPCRPSGRPMPPPAAVLEHPPHTRLQLARVAEARADGAVEVEQQSAVRGVLEVVLASHIEDLDYGLELLAGPSNREGPRHTHIPREVRIVLTQRVAQQDPSRIRSRSVSANSVLWARRALAVPYVSDAALLRHRLRRVDAHPVVDRKAEHPRQKPAVEPVPLVPVAPVVFPLQRVSLRVTESEWVALVVVVRLVEGKRIVQVELEVRGEHAPETYGEPVVAGLGATLHGDQARAVAPELEDPVPTREPRRPGRPEYGVVPVDEPRQVIGPSVGVTQRYREIGRQLAIVRDRRAEGARVLEVLVEDEYRRVVWDAARRREQAVVRRRRRISGKEAAGQRLADRPVGAA